MLTTFPVYATLPITNVARAKKFYQKKLGLKLVSENKKMGVLYFEAGKGTRIELFMSNPPKSGDTTASFKVKDIKSLMGKLRAKGVRFEEYNFAYLKTVNGVATIDNEKAAWFKDPSGNLLCLHQQGRK